MLHSAIIINEECDVTKADVYMQERHNARAKLLNARRKHILLSKAFLLCISVRSSRIWATVKINKLLGMLYSLRQQRH